MYAAGQTLKITATNDSPLKTVFGERALTVTVIEQDEHRLYVRLSDEDAAQHPLKRNQISFAVAPTLPTFYPEWTIEIVEESPGAPVVEAPAPAQPTKLMSRNEWNAYKSGYDVNVPEDTYAEYLAAHTDPEQTVYTVHLPDVGWERSSQFETSVVIEEKRDDGHKISVTVTDDSRRDDYIIDEAMIVDGNNQIVEYLHWNQIRLISYFGGEEVKATFNELWPVMTAGEAVRAFGVAEATVRQAINRKQIRARKSGGTWLLLRKDATERWGRKINVSADD